MCVQQNNGTRYSPGLTLKYTAIADLAETRTIVVFALTETRITPSATSAELRNATPPGFFLIRNPRTAPATHAHVVGGGTAFLLRDSSVIFKSPSSMSCFQVF
jgi:hypothetical protein